MYSPLQHNTKYWKMRIRTTTDNRQRWRLATDPQSRLTGRRKSRQWYLTHTLKTLAPGGARHYDWQTDNPSLITRLWLQVTGAEGGAGSSHAHARDMGIVCRSMALQPRGAHRHVYRKTAFTPVQAIQSSSCKVRPSLQTLLLRRKVQGPGPISRQFLANEGETFLQTVTVELESSKITIANVTAGSRTRQLPKSHKWTGIKHTWKNYIKRQSNEKSISACFI